MEINPYESRLRMLQQIDGVQMQREAAPDEETAGCPGCPFFWTCPVPHRGEEVKAPVDIEFADVEDVLGPRAAYAPRDESDIGWTDDWVDEDGLRVEQHGSPELSGSSDLPGPSELRTGLDALDSSFEPTDGEDEEGENGEDDDVNEAPQPAERMQRTSPRRSAAPAERGRRRASRWNFFRRR
ncbi:hypothetical protein ACTXKL_04745 [Brachybacterium tyrofermentans]|uniref:hypothetical protein n=1 Tax=Brachybacterium tyrofermentans TaxID=47848 RepID=UPI003FD39B39